MELGEQSIKPHSVLIVDDLSFMRSVLREIVEKGGFSVVGEAADGNEAIAEYKKYTPDLVLLDITMPVKDGLAALREIRNYDENARVVMCSSLGQQKYIIRAIQLGAYDFIVKPFTEERVISALQKAMVRS